MGPRIGSPVIGALSVGHTCRAREQGQLPPPSAKTTRQAQPWRRTKDPSKHISETLLLALRKRKGYRTWEQVEEEEEKEEGEKTINPPPRAWQREATGRRGRGKPYTNGKQYGALCRCHAIRYHPYARKTDYGLFFSWQGSHPPLIALFRRTRPCPSFLLQTFNTTYPILCPLLPAISSLLRSPPAALRLLTLPSYACPCPPSHPIPIRLSVPSFGNPAGSANSTCHPACLLSRFALSPPRRDRFSSPRPFSPGLSLIKQPAENRLISTIRELLYSSIRSREPPSAAKPCHLSSAQTTP